LRATIYWAFIFGSLPFIWRRPLWGLILYTFFNIVRPEMFFWGGRTGAKTFIILFAFTWIATILNSGRFDVKAFVESQPLLILWLYGALILSIFLSLYEISRSYYYANEVFKVYLYAVLVIILVDNSQKIKTFENFMLFSFVLLGIWGIQQHFLGNVRLEGLGGRASSDTNGVAALFVLATPLALRKLFYSDNTKKTIAGLALTVVMLLLIIFTQSRGGLLGLIAASSIMILRTKNKIRIFLIASIITVMVLPFIGQSYLNRISTLESEETLGWSAKSRIILWKAGLMVFRDHPLFGSGFLSYPLAKMEYEGEFDDLDPDFKAWVFRTYDPKVTHNTYIQVLSDAGLFAGIPYLLLIFGTLLRNRAFRKKYPITEENEEMFTLLFAVESGIIGFCVCIFFIDALTAVLFPIQIIISGIIRKVIQHSSPGKQTTAGRMEYARTG